MDNVSGNGAKGVGFPHDPIGDRKQRLLEPEPPRGGPIPSGLSGTVRTLVGDHNPGAPRLPRAWEADFDVDLDNPPPDQPKNYPAGMGWMKDFEDPPPVPGFNNPDPSKNKANPPGKGWQADFDRAAKPTPAKGWLSRLGNHFSGLLGRKQG